MKITRKKAENAKVYFADFETTTDKYKEDMSTVYIWGLKNATTNKFDWDLDLDSFFKKIVEEKVEHVFFHNLSFDGNFIFKWLLNNDYRFIEDEYEVKGIGNSWSWLCDETGSIYTLTININFHVVIINCSYKLLMASIAKLGETMGIPKKELKYDEFKPFKSKDEVPSKLIEYLERDIDVAINAVKKLGELYTAKLTCASTSYYDFQQEYGQGQFTKDFGGRYWNFKRKQWEWKNVLTKSQWEMARRSFHGGWVCWKVGIEGKKIKCPNGMSIDCISEYPYVMSTFDMPYGEPSYMPLPEYNLKLMTVHIVYANKINKNHPNFIKEYKGNKYTDSHYTDHIENEERVYWEEEFNFIKKYYDIKYYEVSALYFRSKNVFGKWLDKRFYLKDTAKNEIERNFHKLIFNSLFGKFGQHYKFMQRVIVKAPEDYKFRKGQQRYGKNRDYIHKTVAQENEKYKYMPMSSYICSKGRLNLWTMIMKNVDLWLYRDTDSAYFSDIPKGIEFDARTLGSWKPELQFSVFKVLRAKCYMVKASGKYNEKDLNNPSKIVDNVIYWTPHEKVIKKISGVSEKGKERISWFNFFTGAKIKNGKRGKRNVEGGVLIVEADFKL